MEHKIAFCPLEAEKDKAHPHKPENHDPLIAPGRNEPPCDDQGKGVTHPVGGKESSHRAMGNGEVIFDQRE